MDDHKPDRATTDRGVSTHATRRRVLRAVAAAGALSAVGQPATASQPGTEIELGGQVSGWEGRAPATIEGETNPTLTLVAGVTYTLTWENLDGQSHNFVVEDAEDNHIVETEPVSEEGETQTVAFEATPPMVTYYCGFHPDSMRGDVIVLEDREDVRDVLEDPPPGIRRFVARLLARLRRLRRSLS